MSAQPQLDLELFAPSAESVALPPSQPEAHRCEDPDPLAAFAAVGAESLGAALTDIFDLMQYAEEEIEAMAQARPEAAQRIRTEGFRYIAWHPGTQVTEAVYRAHARELLERLVEGLDLRPGTRAECLMAMSGASQRAPLNATATRLALDLFQQVFGELAGDEPLPPEPYAGAAAELHAQLQRKLACERDCRQR
jgi:hypothetical protein